MTTLEIATRLAKENGFFVFPLHADGKPATPNGFKDASNDPATIKKMAWTEDSLLGVYTGASGLTVLDLDMKVDDASNVLVDGFESLAEAWLEVPDTFAYDSRNGLGRHIVYRAPEGNFPRSMGYRGMKGVDRCSGDGYVAWMGGVPEEGEIADAPEWLLDQKAARKTHNFEGELKEWFEGLTPGEPNALVRKAIERAQETFETRGNDFNHSDMVELQFEAVRLGAEGNSGTAEHLEFLEELFLSREGAHSRPESEWSYEWEEALQSAIAKYGDAIELLKNLPEYSLGLVPTEVPDSLVATPGSKADFSRLLAALIKATNDDNRILSILWNAPATREWSREWGIEFTAKRIADARVKPEPTRENPKLEEKREVVQTTGATELTLLSDEEREEIRKRPTFVDRVQDMARSLGYDQYAYFEAIGWNMASLAFGRKGYVPVSATQSHWLNLWQIVPGWSGTGKSVADNFQTQVLDILFAGDDSEVPYDLGSDSSIQGLHLALLQRDNLPSLFAADEASGWFKRLKANDWTTGLEDTLSDFYMGRVAPSNKISLKELRGKSATTSLCMLMFATPERLMDTLDREQFSSGFLARVMWTFGKPRVETDDMFDIFKESAGRVADGGKASPEVQELALDLLGASLGVTEAVALKPTPEAAKRMSLAYQTMYRYLQHDANWEIIEPATTRHMEAMLKAAGICAMYRGGREITLIDALHAIKAVEKWAKNLVRVADLVSQGAFQRACEDIEEWVKSRKSGKATRAQVYHQFRNLIQRDSRELDNYLSYLLESGSLNREEENGAVKYSVNGVA